MTGISKLAQVLYMQGVSQFVGKTKKKKHVHTQSSHQQQIHKVEYYLPADGTPSRVYLTHTVPSTHKGEGEEGEGGLRRWMKFHTLHMYALNGYSIYT